jgi:dihydrofolate synthase / folylpolyglutamate synthase
MAKLFQTYEEAVEWITGRAPVLGIRPGLGRIEWLMEQLGNPQRRLKFIHVAGTNGKGSTCAFLNETLIRGGYDVGMFTSPYIERFTDRIRYNGHDIERGHVTEIANRLKPLAEQLEKMELGHPTMFELSTAMAILYFATVVHPDFVVWETGLGGRLDVTNIVTPIISVITNIGHDHMDLLGDSLEQVALEKAGIIKAGVPVVSAVEQPECREILLSVAAEKKSSLYLLGREFHYEPGEIALNKQVLQFESPFRPIRDVALSLNGLHQLKNASVALMVLEVLRQYYALVLEDEDLYSAFRDTRWAGRLEMVSENPRILIDGAHNPEGLQSLAATLKGTTYPYRKLHLLMGMIANKNHRDSLRHILPLADTVTVTEPAWRKKCNAEDFAQLAGEVAVELKLDVEIHVEVEWKKALEHVLRLMGPDDMAVVTGTLYLISDVRSWVLHQAESEKGW